MTMALSVTPREFNRLFPNASRSTFAANFGEGIDPKAYAPSLPDPEPKHIALQTLDGGPAGKETSPQRAHVCITRFGLRLLDRDNLTGGAKPLLDCLKEAGLIHDDSPQWCELEVKQEQVTNRMHERTEIKITWE